MKPSFSSIGIIVGLDLVGDALIKLPFLRALRAAWPEASIHWITVKGPTAYSGPLREVTRHLINEIHECPAWLPTEAQVSTTKAPSFDLLIDTRNLWREALKARRAIPHKLFISPSAHFLFSDRRPFLFKPHPSHLVDRLLQLVELAAGYLPPSTSRLPLSEETLATARKILPDGPTYIGLAPGAGNIIKSWPRERFEEIAKRQAAKGRIPVFLLGPQEASWREALAAQIPSAKFPLQERTVWKTEKMTIDQTMAIGTLLSLAVTNDSGTSHMLAAVDTSLVSLFGPTSPKKLAPRVTHRITVTAEDYGSKEMVSIPVESVEKAIEKIILLLKP